MTTGQVAALETRDVVALTSADVKILSTGQVLALNTDQVAAIETADVSALSTAAMAAMTTDQIAALTTGQVMALTTQQTAALSSDQTSHLAVGSPIVLDLTGDGVSTASITQGVQFDVFGVNQKVNTGWVSGGDGLLVMDRNHDGTINGGTELFGVGTNLANGQKASNGYQALAELDTNHDGQISAADANFNELMVWVDQNADGVSEAGELHSLASLGITQLDLHATSSTAMDHGNLLGLVSSYTTADGASHDMADVWFQTHSATPAVTTATTPAPATALATAAGLGTQVADMAQAIGTFTAAAPSGGASAALASQEQAVSLPVAQSLAVDANPVPALVDAMKGFDANGQPTLAPSATSTSVAALRVDATLTPQRDTGVLASTR